MTSLLSLTNLDHSDNSCYFDKTILRQDRIYKTNTYSCTKASSNLFDGFSSNHFRQIQFNVVLLLTIWRNFPWLHQIDNSNETTLWFWGQNKFEIDVIFQDRLKNFIEMWFISSKITNASSKSKIP